MNDKRRNWLVLGVFICMVVVLTVVVLKYKQSDAIGRARLAFAYELRSSVTREDTLSLVEVRKRSAKYGFDFTELDKTPWEKAQFQSDHIYAGTRDFEYIIDRWPNDLWSNKQISIVLYEKAGKVFKVEVIYRNNNI